MLLSHAARHDLEGYVVELSVDESEPLRPPFGKVELHPSQAGQVTAVAAVPELFADHAPVSEVNLCGFHGGDPRLGMTPDWHDRVGDLAVPSAV